MFKTVGLVARYDRKPALEFVEEIANYLKSKDLKVSIEDTLSGKVTGLESFVPLSEMRTDFVITLGGDGTILRTAMTLPKPEPPILAVNMGIRGFLTEVEPQQVCGALDRILNGDFVLEKCTKLSVSSDGEAFPDALNDIVISAGQPSKLLYTQICKDEKPILKCQADGLIVATQTGSTGYSLSAGGPVLDQELDAFVLTPICSLTVFHSLVFEANSIISVNVLRPEEILVLIDGHFCKRASSKELVLKVTRSRHTTSFIRFEADFYDRLRNRLLFKGTE